MMYRWMIAGISLSLIYLVDFCSSQTQQTLVVTGVGKTEDVYGYIVVRLNDGNSAYICSTASTDRNRQLTCQYWLGEASEPRNTRTRSPPNASIPILARLGCSNAGSLLSCIPSYTTTCNYITIFDCDVSVDLGDSQPWGGYSYYIGITAGVVVLVLIVTIPMRMMRRRALLRGRRRQQDAGMQMQGRPLQVPSVSNQITSGANYPRQQPAPAPAPAYGLADNTQDPNVDPLVARGYSAMPPPAYDSVVQP